MDHTSPYTNGEDQDSSVPNLEWDQPWDAFIAEVNRAVPPFNFDSNGTPIDDTAISPLSTHQDVHMTGVVEDWLHDSTTFRQPSNPQIWSSPGVPGQRVFPSEHHEENTQKSVVRPFPGVQALPVAFQESVSNSTADGGRSRASSVPSTQEDFLSATETPDQESKAGSSNPTSPKAADFQCHLCPKTFTRALNLRQHLRGHTNEKPFVCKICDRGFARAQDRKRHEAFHFDSPSESPVMSRQGSMASMHSAASATSSAGSRRGLRIPGGYTCRQCNRAFDVPSDLAQHERNHRPKDQRPHACPHCDERFLYPKDLGRHIRRKHTDDKPESSTNNTTVSPTASKTQTATEPIKPQPEDTEPLPSFESIERVNHISPSTSNRPQRSPSGSSLYQSADDPLESLAEVITGIPPGLRNMLFASMSGSEQELKVRLAKVWLGGIEVLLKTKMRLSDEQSQRTTQALEQLAFDLNRLEMQDDGNG